MTDYRAIVEHVRFWRGAMHHWSTSYSLTGSGSTPDTTACQTLLAADSKMLADISTGLSQGDAYRCAIYHASGGTPLAVYQKFDPTAQANWTHPVAGGWTSTFTALDQVAENALLVEWPAGLSSSGKPVTFKKFFHSIPTSAGRDGTQDVTAANVTSLTAAATALGTCLNPTYGLLIGNSGRLAGTPKVRAYYVNHQMPRGRRKKATSEARAASFGSTVLKLAESEAYKNADA